MFKDPPREWLSEDEKKDFRISFDVIVKHDLWSTSNWKEHPATLAMASMLMQKDVEVLFQEVIENEPMVESNMEELREWLRLSKSDNLKVKEANRKLIRDFLSANEGAGAGNNPFNLYYIYEYRYFGVNLNQPIEVKKENENFPLLFSFRLSKTHYPFDFLNYHLSATYNNNTVEYRRFLTLIQDKHTFLLSSLERSLNQWVIDKTNQQLKEPLHVTPTIGSYLVKFLCEVGEQTKKSLIDKVAIDYQLNAGSLRTEFFKINKENEKFHKDHREEIQVSIKILKEIDMKAYRIAEKFLKSI